MWIQLDSEYLNLDQIVRVRFNKGWKNGSEELVAEVEGLIKGEVQVFTRYRGPAAVKLQDILNSPAARKPRDVFATHEGDGSRALSNTLHDMQLPLP